MSVKCSRYAVVATLCWPRPVDAAFGQTLIVGDDQKQGADQNFKPIFREPGHDTLSIIDISRPDTPRDHGDDPADELGRWTADQPRDHTLGRRRSCRQFARRPVIQGWGQRLEPDNKVFVVDLKPIRQKSSARSRSANSLPAWRSARSGDLALVANRGDGTISVLGDPREGRPCRRHGCDRGP